MGTITEKKMIVEFMGGLWNTHSNKYGIGNAEYVDYNDKHNAVRAINHYTIDELKYDSSWDWIMPVVEKIGKLKNFLHPFGIFKYLVDFKIEISNNCVTIKGFYDARFDAIPTIEYYKNDLITNLFDVCVEFIKWYNETKENIEKEIKSLLELGKVEEAIEYAKTMALMLLL